jgi:hypothetical protein
MRFYYFSIFSWFAYALYLWLLFIAFWLIWTKALKLRISNPGYWILITALALAPWGEELWIAYEFGQLCGKDAGVVISKTAQIDGFYDDTTHWWRQLEESSYQFVESRDRITNTLWRAERAGDEVRHFRIDKPTARYHYTQPHEHTPVAHQINEVQYLVKDTQSGEILAKDTMYVRHAYWFFMSTDAPAIVCPAPGQDPNEKYGVIYKQVLKPIGVP